MRGLPRPSAADEEYLRRSLAAGGQGYVAEMEDAARAWLALMAAEVAPGPLIAVVESALALDLLAQDIGTLSGREHVATARANVKRRGWSAGSRRRISAVNGFRRCNIV